MQEVSMKRLSVLAAMGAIALMAGGASGDASAATVSRHRAHLVKAPQTIVRSYGAVQRPAAQAKPYDRLAHPYESDSLGKQWFPNPDRVFTTGNYP
jgi:hypothetical protein